MLHAIIGLYTIYTPSVKTFMTHKMIAVAEDVKDAKMQFIKQIIFCVYVISVFYNLCICISTTSKDMFYLHVKQRDV